MEDIVAVLDGRPELIAEIRESSEKVRTYLAEKFAAMFNDPKFVDALPGHLLPDMASQARLPLLLEQIREIIQIATT
jgi:hypothetical protein